MSGTTPHALRLIVIGGGPGGYTAALRAAQLGAEVTLVEKGQIGGTCLNRGCIPTKALLSSVEALGKARSGGDFGFTGAEGAVPDFSRMQERKNDIVSRLRDGVSLLLRKRNVTVAAGSAHLTGPGSVEVASQDGRLILEADRVILATGAEPAMPPFFDFSHHAVVTSTELLELEEIPSSLLIVGAGAIGSEFLSIFTGLGTKVTMVEMMPQILPVEDPRVAKQLQGAFRKAGAEVLVKTKVERVVDYGERRSITVELTGGTRVTAEKLLVSIGRRPNSDDLGLEAAGVEVDARGFVKVDGQLRTTAPGVFAVGDITGGMLLAHVAYYDGVLAAENSLGGSRERDLRLVPRCVYSIPELAAVGLSEEQAREEGFDPITGTFRLAALGKALALGESQGFVQLVVDRLTDTILGANMMGAHMTDVIHEVAVAMAAGITCRDLAHVIHAHPTIAEAVMEAAAEAHGESVHVAS